MSNIEKTLFGYSNTLETYREMLEIGNWMADLADGYSGITQPVRTLFLFKSIWICPQRSQGYQKMRQDPLNMLFEVWCANIAPKLKNI